MRNKEKIMKTIKFRKLEDPTTTVEPIVPTKEFGYKQPKIRVVRLKGFYKTW